MGLLDKLTTEGSDLSVNNGQQITPNPLSTVQSQLHATQDGNSGYSLDGTGENVVAQQYAQYNDGISNPLPLPSQIDLNGQIPATAGHGNSTPGASTQALPYIDNIPN
tara:strand:- start:128 stop:451 length:324 start_codon:yes stop_codon:yes gene_type:complete